ncbi:hypothetical protein AMATHDRAFT_43268 [Amanita thiersii Skay4041]|uniref:Uncharacterized protein n=1 Tax=Amanita thiersii Skay4041 TaxID=703135 RepID=A0A2A9NF91_9AGAR|nr:hypothetical protein AMATHDRAFT_43268 [Amanita thiersii Skay4041]
MGSHQRQPHHRPGAPRIKYHNSDNDTDDNDDAPETYTLTESKHSAKRKNEDIGQAQAAVRKKAKLRNQQRDRVLKEQAAGRRERERRMLFGENEVEEEDGDGEHEGEDEGDGGDNLRRQMERVMKETRNTDGLADEGEDEESDEDEFKGLYRSSAEGSEAEGDSGVEEDEDSEFLHIMQNEELMEKDSEEDDDDEDDQLPSDRLRVKKLPDHLFEAAFAQRSPQPSSPQTHQKSITKSKQRAQKTHNRKPQHKDVIIGTRTFRTLPTGPYANVKLASSRPTADRAHIVRKGDTRIRGWERRAANIGSMRRDGPAANFVRR